METVLWKDGIVIFLVRIVVFFCFLSMGYILKCARIATCDSRYVKDICLIKKNIVFTRLPWVVNQFDQLLFSHLNSYSQWWDSPIPKVLPLPYDEGKDVMYCRSDKIFCLNCIKLYVDSVLELE